jgi:hypothetical protein
LARYAAKAPSLAKRVFRVFGVTPKLKDLESDVSVLRSRFLLKALPGFEGSVERRVLIQLFE